MRTSPLHLIRARGLLVSQPRLFAVRARASGSRRKRATFLIELLRPDVPLRLLPQVAMPGPGNTSPAAPKPVPAA